MPLYEYECRKCGHRFEKIQKFSDPTPRTCPHCKTKGKIHRLLSAPAIQFKGSGWYITDYARKGSPDSKSEGKDEKAGKSEGDKSAKDKDKKGTKSAPKKSGDD